MCDWKMNVQGYFQLFFWFGMLVGLLSPIAIYYNTYEFFDIWPVIQRFFVLFSVNSSWLMLISPIGYFLLQGKISNKAVSGAYSVCLCMVIVLAMVSIAFSQSQSINMDDPEGSVIFGIRDYFDENGNIPEWLHDLQSRERCCGFSGPEDWRLLIYPPDKPAIEDVPESCCITRVVGCNLILDAFKNKTELSYWIFTTGCRKPIERKLNSLLDVVSYGEIVMLVVAIILISIYWINLNTILRKLSEPQEDGNEEQVQDGENTEENGAAVEGEVEPAKAEEDNNNVNVIRSNKETKVNNDIGGCSGGESPAAMPGSDLNSRRASFQALSPRSVQFRPRASRNRLVITKSRSETNTNDNNNTTTTVVTTTSTNNNKSKFVNASNTNNNTNSMSKMARNNNSRTSMKRESNKNLIANNNDDCSTDENPGVRSSGTNRRRSKSQPSSKSTTGEQMQQVALVPTPIPSGKFSKLSRKQKKQKQLVLQEIIIETEADVLAEVGKADVKDELEEGEEENNNDEDEAEEGEGEGEEEEDEDPGDRLNIRPVKTSSRLISRKSSAVVNNSTSNRSRQVTSNNRIVSRSNSSNKNSSSSSNMKRSNSKSSNR